jgi:DNA (cytosine-5)-methyltransferase 1
MNQGIIIDSFAGGGGVSSGLKEAGLIVNYAINHDADAIAMYKINHPGTIVFNENILEVDPREVAKGRPIYMAWFSPDCTHHSRARGGKPREKKIRALAWVILRWAATVKPEVIILENVVEFQEWGPLTIEGKPDPKQKSRTFNSFVNALRRQGYAVEWRELVACDYGAPTSRKRFFLIARRDGKPIVWPERTHGDPDSLEVMCGLLKPWRTAAECIDWSLPCPSIFARKKPLADNTQRRIAKGLDKFVLKNQKPYIIQVNHGGENFRGQDISEPLQTVTAKHGYGIVTPHITKFQQNSIGQVMEQPLDTVMAGATRFGLIAPTLAQIGQTGGNDRLHGIEEPLSTIVSKQEHMLIAPTLIQYHGERSCADSGHRGQVVDAPLKTVDASNRYGLTAAYISKYYGGFYDGAGSDVDEPLHTVTSKDHNAIITSNLVQFNNNCDGKAMDKPVPTVVAGQGHWGEMRSLLTTYNSNDIGQEVDQPLRTVVSKDRFGLVSVKVKTTGALGNWPKIRELLNKYCGYNMADDEVLLLPINGIYYFIYDLGMRMLEPRELYNAQGVGPDYVIDFVKPNGKRYSKAAQVARCGNMVPPQFAKALAMANRPDLCGAKEKMIAGGGVS